MDTSPIHGFRSLRAISYQSYLSGFPADSFNLIKNEWNPFSWWLAGSALLTNFAWCMPQFCIGAEISGQFLIPALSGKGGQVLIALFHADQCGCLFFSVRKIRHACQLHSVDDKRSCSGNFNSLHRFPSNSSTSFTFSLSELFAGFLPSSKVLSETSPIYATLIQASGGANDFWNEQILEKQRSLVLTSFSSAPGLILSSLSLY